MNGELLIITVILSSFTVFTISVVVVQKIILMSLKKKIIIRIPVRSNRRIFITVFTLMLMLIGIVFIISFIINPQENPLLFLGLSVLIISLSIFGMYIPWNIVSYLILNGNQLTLEFKNPKKRSVIVDLSNLWELYCCRGIVNVFESNIVFIKQNNTELAFSYILSFFERMHKDADHSNLFENKDNIINVGFVGRVLHERLIEKYNKVL